MRAWIPALLASVMGLALASCSAAIDPIAIEDAQTAVRVKTALVNDPDIGTRAIEVRVVRGVVHLSGRVLTEAEAARAIELARSVDGVREVQPTFQIGEAVPEVPGDGSARRIDQGYESPELEPNPQFLAVGGSVGWSRPRADGLERHLAFSPLVKLGSGRGLGPAITFDWFQANLKSLAGGGATLSRVRVRPVMVGASYTLAADRLSIAPSIVGGWAFNSLTITKTGVAEGVPVEVEDGPAWRVGASMWYDVSRRIALYVSAGYLVTNLRITVLEAGRFEKRDQGGNTVTTHVGMAYRLF